MKREPRGFSGLETALFPTMLVNEQLYQDEGKPGPKQEEWALGYLSPMSHQVLQMRPSLRSKQGEAHETAGHRMESDDTKVVDFSTASPQKDDDEINLAETLVNIKKSAAKDKGKSIMQEFEPPKKIKKKEMIQISLDEEIAQRFYEEEQA
nr:hypothetical protein [Tanacetum cinerariifolium]